MKIINHALIFLASFGMTLGVHAQAPASLRGSTLFQTISSGDGTIFDASGYTVVFVANAANSYNRVDLVGNLGTSGTFTYTQSVEDAFLTVNDNQAGSFGADYTFSDSTSGSFLFTQGASAFQEGSFAMYSGQAPASVIGKTATLEIIDGGGGADSSGTQTVSFSNSGYILTDDSGPHTGSFTYSLANKSTGKVAISSSSGTGSLYLSFSDPVSGAFAAVKSNGRWQIGTFTIPDTTPPILTITAPIANQRWSNDVFTVTGKATDDVGVAFVDVSTDGNDPIEATPSLNGWTNWTAEVTLTPGTNTISARAFDENGNSKTNTVKVVYILSAPLLVSTNGKGSISPALNGALLQIGKSYTMTATPAVGFAFTNWTDGNSTIITNKPALKFLMASNLAFTANFVDIAKPTVSVTNIPAGGNVSNSLFIAKGKAGDNLAVEAVFYNLNSAGWNTAATANNFTNWSAADLELTPGTNFLSTYAVDTTGNSSLTNTVKFVYILSAPLTVSTNGKGSITPALNNALLQIGKNYTLTAKPAAGFVFTNWTDGNSLIVTNKPVLTFLMASNLSFTANFVDIAKPVLTVTTPTAAASATSEFYLAKGKALDNAGVTAVFYNLNNIGWFTPSTTNNYTNWNVTLGLTPGTNFFSAYAVDTSGNFSATNNTKFIYTTAPATLSGLAARVTPDGVPDFGVAFGATTFSQASADTNNVNGVGSYTYTRQTPSSGQLKLTYTAPPAATNEGLQIIKLAFTAPGIARFTNGVDVGSIVFTSTPTLVPASILNRTAVAVNDQGEAQNLVFTAGKYVSSNLVTHTTKTNITYTYSTYGPVGALVKHSDTNGQKYTVLTFVGTNYGTAYAENYDVAGTVTEVSRSVFGLASQRASGNAPTNLVNRSTFVFNGGDASQFLFPDTNNFVQLSATDSSITNGLGNYVYGRTGTNTANLDVNFTTPAAPSFTVPFQFIAPNFATFTNADESFGAAVFK